MPDRPLIACPDCDLMQTEPMLPVGSVARCARCEVPLFKRTHNSIERASALAISASIFFLLANVFPLVGLEVQGSSSHTTLIGAVHTLVQEDRLPIAVLVFITTILVPAVELTLMNYLLIPLRRDRVPRHAVGAMRLMRTLKPWGMVEVFMLGMLVSLVKLSGLAQVVTGVALYALAALIILFAAAASAFNPHEIWDRIDADRNGTADADEAEVARG
jgi:paraquat-inducible protein A